MEYLEPGRIICLEPGMQLITGRDRREVCDFLCNTKAQICFFYDSLGMNVHIQYEEHGKLFGMCQTVDRIEDAIFDCVDKLIADRRKRLDNHTNEESDHA